jgi:hypothetical protein
MPFSPDIYGQQNAAALNTLERKLTTLLVSRYSSARRFPFHTPDGTPLEADLMLSCTGFKWSLVGRVMKNSKKAFQGKYSEVDREVLDLFITTTPLSQQTLYPYGATVESILKLRDSIRQQVAVQNYYHHHSPEEEEGGIRHHHQSGAAAAVFFDDLLFGPHVAKVLNALMELEIQTAERTLVHCPHFWPHYALFFMGEQEEEVLRLPFALVRTTNGSVTAVAADLLLLQHAFHQDKPRPYELAHRLYNRHLEPVIRTGGDFGLLKALSPTFHGALPTTKKRMAQVDIMHFRQMFGTAIGNVRAEIDFITTTIDRVAVPILMAGTPRLGSESPLGKIEKEVLCIIVRFLIESCRGGRRG